MLLRTGWPAAVACLLLAGCGGGGGDSGSTPKYSVQVAPGAVQFSARARGAVPASQTLTASFRGDGLVVGYPPGVSAPSWLSASVVGSPNSSPAQIQLSVVYTGQSAATYSTTLRFVAGNSAGTEFVVQDVSVTYVVTDPLDVNVTKLTFDATAGTAPLTQAVQVTGASISWAATASQPWLTLSSLSGVTPSAVTVTADALSLPSGTYTAELRVSDRNSSAVSVVPVTFYVSANRWNANRIGVSLLSYSDSQARPADVVITNDQGAAANWTATPDVNWLSVTAGGASGSSLRIALNTANAATLAADAMYFGTVTISGAGIPSDTVRVGYYKSSAAAPGMRFSNYDLSAITQVVSTAADPIRPYVYFDGATNSIQRINLVTGAIDTLATVPNAQLWGLTVSGDGHYLYAGSGAQPGNITRVDLDTGTQLAPLARATICCEQYLTWVRVRGVPLLVGNFLDVYNLATGITSPSVSVASNAFNRFYNLTATRGGEEIWNFAYDFNSPECYSARSYHVTTRPATGDGYLTDYFGRPPLIAGTSNCPTVQHFTNSVNDSAWQIISLTTLYTGPVGGPVTAVATRERYDYLAASNDGHKAASYRALSQSGKDGAEIFDNADTRIGDLTDFYKVNGIVFSSDSRFLVLVGTGASGQGAYLAPIP